VLDCAFGAAVAVLIEGVQAGDRPRNAANFLTL
jgi:predicted outer membrane lipoprotein